MIKYEHERIPYLVTGEPLDDKHSTPETDELLVQMHGSVAEGDTSLIKPLRQLIKKYPKVVQFKNHLAYLLETKGKQAEVRELVARTVREHPGSVSAVCNLANIYAQHYNNREKAKAMMGHSLWLEDRFPGRKVFHETEVLTYYFTACRLLLEEDSEEAIRQAEERFGIMKTIAPGHPDTQKVSRSIDSRKLVTYSKNLQERMLAHINAEQHCTAEYEPRAAPPALQHEPLHTLYEYEELPESVWAEIEALPSDSLNDDLALILEDGIRRYAVLKTEAEERGGFDGARMSFVFNALQVLSVLGTSRALPMLFDFLRQEEDLIQFYTGFDQEKPLLHYFSRLLPEQLGTLQSFVREPYVSVWGKLSAVKAVIQLCWHQPGMRETAESWVESFFEYLLEHRDEAGLIDSALISWSALDAAELSMQRVMPYVKEAYELGFIPDDMAGPISEYLELAEMPPREHHREPLPQSLEEAFTGSYEDRRAERIYTKEEEEELERAWRLLKEQEEDENSLLNAFRSTEDSDEPAAPPPEQRRVSKKIGRNEPCPCGSGKKYKRCCGKK